MSQRPTRRAPTVWGLVALLLLGLVGSGCGDGPDPPPLRVTGPSSAAEGDTIWVDVTLSEDARQTATDAQFQLHYTTAHLKGLHYEVGPAVRTEGAAVQHYPSKASFDFGLPLRAGSSETAPLVRVQFRVKETAPRGVPSHLRLADLELLQDDGGMRRIRRGDSTRIAIRSVDGTSDPRAALDVGDQYTIRDTITVGRVVVPDSGRILVRATTPEGDNRIVGTATVPPGRHENLRIGLDPDFNLEEKQFAFLEAGLYRIGPQSSRPERFQNDGTPVQSTFTAHYRTSTPESQIIVRDKPLTNRTLVVDSVLATEPADLVIHRNRHDGPLIPGIIGKTRVGTGVNENVEIEIFEDETVVCGETLWPMLHVRSESADQPYEIDYPIITEPVTIRCE